MAGKRKYNFTQEQKQDMVRMYECGIRNKDIMESYGIKSEQTLYDILHEMNVELRSRQISADKTDDSSKPKSKSKSKRRTCECGHINPPESRFCNQCDKELKTEEEKIIDNLRSARNWISFLPESKRESVDKRLMDAIKLLKKKCGFTK